MSKEQATTPSQFWIVNEISRILNLGDNGKLNSFAGKVIKTLNKEIKVADRNIIAANNNFETLKEDLEEKLEDARVAVTDAYTNVPMDELETNDSQRNFMEKYLSRIDKCEGIILGYEEKLKEILEKRDEKIQFYNNEKELRNKRIQNITAGFKK